MVYRIYKELSSVWGDEYYAYCGAEYLGTYPSLERAKEKVLQHKNRELVHEEQG